MDVGNRNHWQPELVVPSKELAARIDERWPLEPLERELSRRSRGALWLQGWPGRSRLHLLRDAAFLRRLLARAAVVGWRAVHVPVRHAGHEPARCTARRRERRRSCSSMIRNVWLERGRPLQRAARGPAALGRQRSRRSRCTTSAVDRMAARKVRAHARARPHAPRREQSPDDGGRGREGSDAAGRRRGGAHHAAARTWRARCATSGHRTKKGPVFDTAIIAGVMAAKRTHELIPFCHPLRARQVRRGDRGAGAAASSSSAAGSPCITARASRWRRSRAPPWRRSRSTTCARRCRTTSRSQAVRLLVEKTRRQAGLPDAPAKRTPAAVRSIGRGHRRADLRPRARRRPQHPHAAGQGGARLSRPHPARLGDGADHARSSRSAFVSVRPDQVQDPVRAQYPQIVDTHENLGPIAGIIAAQAAHPDAAWLVLACDLPFLDAATLEHLLWARQPAAPRHGVSLESRRVAGAAVRDLRAGEPRGRSPRMSPAASSARASF